jgi:DNA-binding beta-propeller fold protein YncE
MNIDPSGTFLYAANQNTDTIAVFRIQPSNGKLKFSTLVDTPTPVDVRVRLTCLTFLSTGARTSLRRAPSIEPQRAAASSNHALTSLRTCNRTGAC